MPSRPFIVATHEYLPFRGGAAAYVHEVCSGAWKLGYRLEIWAPTRRGSAGAARPSSPADTNAYSFNEPPVVRFVSSGRLTPLGLGALAWGWWRQRRQLRERPVLLMSVGAQMIFFWFAVLGVVAPENTLVMFYGSEVLRFGQGRVWHRLARQYYARAGGFAACSHFTAELAQRSGLLPPGAKVTVAPCALPAAFVKPAQACPDVVANGTWRLLTVARLHPRKGQREVATALGLLPAALRERIVYQMVGVGANSYRAEIAAACRTSGVRCEFLGGIDDEALGAVYRQCTIYVQASRTLPRSVEGFGISFLEAAVYGKPAAAFRSGGVGEAVVDGETALLVPEGDLPGLAAAVQRLLEDSALRHTLGENGRAFVATLRWEDSARRLFDALAAIHPVPTP